jgi:hypothetical protein
MIRVTDYDISDAVSFTHTNHADGALKQCYPKPFDKFSPVQLYINRSKAGGRPPGRIEHALNDAPELASFRTPFPDDPSLIYVYNQNRIRTAIRLALRGARWILGCVGQGASPICRTLLRNASPTPPDIRMELLLNDSSITCSIRHRRSDPREIRTTGIGHRPGDVGLVGGDMGKITHD